MLRFGVEFGASDYDEVQWEIDPILGLTASVAQPRSRSRSEATKVSHATYVCTCISHGFSRNSPRQSPGFAPGPAGRPRRGSAPHWSRLGSPPPSTCHKSHAHHTHTHTRCQRQGRQTVQRVFIAAPKHDGWIPWVKKMRRFHFGIGLFSPRMDDECAPPRPPPPAIL